MANLYRADGTELRRVAPQQLAKEQLLEDWVANDLSLLGLEAVLVGRQVTTSHGKRIDLLAIDTSGELVIIELKRDRTPREIVAQVLDYASWARTLTASEVCDLVEKHRRRRLADLFEEELKMPLPERLNDTHSMVIVAGEIDSESRRIVEYLSDQHQVGINTFFFSVFEVEGRLWVTTESQLDQDEFEARRERNALAPWLGYWYVIVQTDDENEQRSWKDMEEYGFVAAGGAPIYGKRLGYLKKGAKIFAFWPKRGYVGYGTVTEERVPASQFETKLGVRLDQVKLDNRRLMECAGDPESQQYAVGVDWHSKREAAEAVWEPGLFRNPNTVCKLRDPTTIRVLADRFGIDRSVEK